MISFRISLETKQWPFHIFVHTDLSVKYLFMAKWTIFFIHDWSSSAFLFTGHAMLTMKLEVRKLAKTLENKAWKDQGSPECQQELKNNNN